MRRAHRRNHVRAWVLLAVALPIGVALAIALSESVPTDDGIEAVRAAIDFYHTRLMSADDAGHARAYLRSRGYDADTVNQFRLGYAPAQDRSDHLVRELRARGIDDRAMIDAGLARRGRGGSLYDYFRDRLMFPTWDIQGEPVGFGGRILGDGQPKYLNTPETPLYKKSRLLYGLDRARREIQRAGYAVVVEGYTDVIGFAEAGIPRAVATCGTALTEDHVKLLKRFSADRLVLAFDADEAGDAMARAMIVSHPEIRRLRPLRHDWNDMLTSCG